MFSMGCVESLLDPILTQQDPRRNAGKDRLSVGPPLVLAGVSKGELGIVVVTEYPWVFISQAVGEQVR